MNLLFIIHCFSYRLLSPLPRDAWTPQTQLWDGETLPPRKSRSSTRGQNHGTFGKASEDQRTTTSLYLMTNTPMTGRHEFGIWRQNMIHSKLQRLCVATGQPPYPTLCRCSSQTSMRQSNQVRDVCCVGTLKNYLLVFDSIDRNSPLSSTL